MGRKRGPLVVTKNAIRYGEIESNYITILQPLKGLLAQWYQGKQVYL